MVGITNVPTSIKDPQLRMFLQQVKTAIAAGLLDGARSASNTSGSSGGTGTPAGPNPFGDLSTPAYPTGLTGAGGFTSIVLNWDLVPYPNNVSHTEIWRSDHDTQADAVLIGTAVSFAYIDAVSYDETWFYWIRFISYAGIPSAFNSLAGLAVSTGVNVDALIALMTGLITSTQLATDLRTRIDTIDTPGGILDRLALTETDIGGINTLTDSLGAQVLGHDEDITALDVVVLSPTTGVAATSAAVGALTSRVTSAEGTITSTAGSVTALQSTVNNPTTGVTATAGLVNSLSTTVSNHTGTLSSQATSISTLTSTSGSNTASISALSSVTNGLSAQYMVKVVSGQYVSGFGLATDATGTSTFLVSANRFAIGDPLYPNKIPFIVATVNGVTTIALNAATLIPDASITGGRIANVTIEDSNIKAGTITGAKIDGGTITGANIQGGAITNTHITDGVISGAKIAGGSITGAKIDTGTIGTLNIAGQAVTLPASGSGSMSISLTTSYQLVGFINVDWGSNPPSAVSVIGICGATQVGGVTCGVELQVYSSFGGTQGDINTAAVNGATVCLSTSHQYGGTTGMVTYGVKMKSTLSGSHNATTWRLIVIGTRR